MRISRAEFERLTGRQVDSVLTRAGVEPAPKRKRKMTNLERAWAAELELGRQIRDIAWWDFEPITLKLAPDTRYTPDFAWIDPLGHLHFDETKGRKREDAMAKLKIAAAKFWWAPFRLVTRAKGRNGAWAVRVVESGHFSLENAEQRQRRPSATSRPTAMQPQSDAGDDQPTKPGGCYNSE